MLRDLEHNITFRQKFPESLILFPSLLRVFSYNKVIVIYPQENYHVVN